MTYKVQLPVFEGPLDLLLYLIKKDEINIYDIPIASVTAQYLEHLEMMKLLDLEIAGEFLVMAATLIHIKSKMLLPQEVTEDEDFVVEEDPREELVKKLLEYKKFKEAAGQFKELFLREKDSFPPSPGSEIPVIEEDKKYFEASLFDLITAFSKVLREVPKGTFHQVVRDEYTVSDKIHRILHLLVEKTKILFSDLFKNVKTRGEVVAIFLALLELVKLKEVAVQQDRSYGEIEITRNSDWEKRG